MTTATTPVVFRVTPYGYTMASVEQAELSFDATPLLQGAQTVQTPTVVCTNITATPQTIVTLPDAPTISGNLVVQEVRGSSLTVGSTYTLSVTFVADADTTWLMVQQITVPI